MDLQAEKILIKNMVEQENDPNLLEIIKEVLGQPYKSTKARMSIDQYNAEIDLALDDIKTGKIYSSTTMEDKISEWKKR